MGQAEPPAAPRRPVVDRYWGTDVVDDYQYLERLDEEGVAWALAQTAVTRARLDARPERERILARIVELTHAASLDYWGFVRRGGLWFAMKEHPPKEQPLIVAFPSVHRLDE